VRTMANVADIHTIIEIPGHIGIYEVQTGKALLVKECADRDEAEAWMAHERRMDQVADRIHAEYVEMMSQWMTDIAEEHDMPREHVSSLISLDTPRIKEDPADSANGQRGEEKDPMQDPSAVKIPDNQPPVKPPEAVFPLPADHECDREGVGAPYSGEWDYAEDHDLPQLMIQNAMERVATPVSLTKMYLSGKVLRIAEAHLPPDVSKDLYWHWRIDDDLETVMGQVNAHVASLVSTNLPARFTSLDGTLRTAMVNGGLCCEEAANQLIASCLMRDEMALMEEHIPGFNPQWLTIQGAEDPKETLLGPAGPRPEGWPQKPVPEPPKRISKDTVQVTLRGQPISEPDISGMDDGESDVQFYNATFKLLSNDTVFRVHKSHHNLEELDAECNAIWKARDVQVSGIMMSASKDDDYDMAVLIDQWLPITEEADASA